LPKVLGGTGNSRSVEKPVVQKLVVSTPVPATKTTTQRAVTSPTQAQAKKPVIGVLQKVDPVSADWLKPISGMILVLGLLYLAMSALDSWNGRPEDKSDFFWSMAAVALVLFSERLNIVTLKTVLERRLAGAVIFLIALLVVFWKSKKGGWTPVATFFTTIGVAGIMGVGLGQLGIALNVQKTPTYFLPDAIKLLIAYDLRGLYTTLSVLGVLAGVVTQTIEAGKSAILPAVGMAAYLVGFRLYGQVNPFLSIFIVGLILVGVLLIPRVRLALGISQQSSKRSIFDCLGLYSLGMMAIFILTGVM